MPKLTIAGYTSCGFYQRALTVAKQVASKDSSIELEVVGITRPQYQDWLKHNLHNKGISHRTSPAVLKDGVFIGGCDEFLASVSGKY